MEKKKIIMILCIALLVMTVGYAALSRVININGTAEITSTWNLQFTSISATGGTDGATEINTPNASGTTATFHVGLKAPGDEITYLITLKNLGSINAVISEITASELGNDAIKFEVTDIAKGDKIAGQTEKVFKVKISFDSSVTEQPSLNDNKIELTIKCVQDLSQTITPGDLETSKTRLAAKILSDNIPQSDVDIDFSKTSEEDGTSGLYYTSTNTENNRTTYYFRGDVDNNYVKFGTENAVCTYNNSSVLYADMDSEAMIWNLTEEQCTNESNVCVLPDVIAAEVGAKYVVGFNETFCTEDVGGTWTNENAVYGYYTSCNYNGEEVYYSIESRPSSLAECMQNKVCELSDGTKKIYFVGASESLCQGVGGTVLDYATATFSEEPSGLLWRIVRINEDGSIRLIHQENIGDYEFDSGYNDNAYVGYMYGTPGSDNYEDTHANVHDSIIKGVLDEWYVSNLSSYENYLVDSGFCNDRSLASGKGINHAHTYYGAEHRIRLYNSPQFACPNVGNDLFTMATNAKGNKALTYPIGLITADEVAYAGGAYAKDSNHYLDNGREFWTMSPGSAGGNTADVWKGSHLYWNGAFINGIITSSVRPVINLRADIEITDGNGTEAAPYIIKTN